MECLECCYCWKEEDEKYPVCHWISRAPGDLPPCEYEEEETYNEFDERW